MTAHVLHAGNGYTYLTRQVAHGDVNRERGQELADYYTAKGAPAGRWLGSGVAALEMTGPVTEEHMKALYGEGLHPDAQARFIEPARVAWAAQFKAEHGREPTTEELVDGAAAWVDAAPVLGRRYPTFDTTREELWRQAVAAEVGRVAGERGVAPGDLDRAARAEAKQAAGWKFFIRDRGREPLDEGELRQHIAKCSKPTPQPVAGYDLVFTPAKSVSVLWGLGDDHTRTAIEAAHRLAMGDVIAYLEQEAAFTRIGAGGVAQVETHGLVATAFDHYDSRAGDPNFHTHLAVANKVQGKDGKWRSIDGRVLHAAAVSASERYNATVERELEHTLGVAFEDRSTGRDKRPVREIAGVPVELLTEFSARRNAIEDRYDQLRAEYRAAHGHEPSKAMQHKLAQQATLDTRGAKEELESLAEKQAKWLPRAAAVVGQDVVEDLVARCQQVAIEVEQQPAPEVPTAAELGRLVVRRVSADRSRWKVWHLRAEAERQVRRHGRGLSVEEARDLVEAVTAVAVAGESILLEAPEAEAFPSALTRENGESIFRVHGSEWFSSTAVLRAEDRLLDAAAIRVAAPVDEQILAAWSQTRPSWSKLDAGQQRLVRHFASSDRLLVVGVGAAGAGKSTAMEELAAACTAVGRRVVAVAPSAVAAQGLAEKIGSEATTIAKLLHTLETQGTLATGLREGDVLLVDEAGMASTRDLDRLVQLARDTGSVVRLLGDPAQLSAVEAGGAFRLLVHRTDAVELTTLHRFIDKDEAAATLGLRAGDSGALDFYEDGSRIHSGTRDGVLEQIYGDWMNDMADGKASIMLAGDSETVRALSTRARLDRIAAGLVERDGVALHDGSTAGVGDVIVTRRNDRRLAMAGAKDFVKNGDMWIVTDVLDNGSVRVRHRDRPDFEVGLPPAYVRDNVELGYALTIHRAQGVTVDAARTLVDDSTAREGLYVAMSRGREENHSYVVTDSVVDVDLHHATDRDRSARHVLEDVLGRDNTDRSATETIADAQEQAESLSRLVPEYEHARGAAAAQSGRVDEVLRGALVDQLGDQVGEEYLAKLRSDQAWHALADRVAALEDEGRDSATVVRAAVQAGLEDAHSPAAVLTWRINQGAARGGLEEHLARPGAIREPSGRGSATGQRQGSLEGWLEQRRQRISARVEQLTTRAIEEQPNWLVDAIGPMPAASAEADRYRAVARAAAVYRDRYGITDTHRPLGHEPEDGRQRRDWRRVTEAIDAVAQDRGESEVPSVEVQERAERMRRLRERANRTPGRGAPAGERPGSEAAAARQQEQEEVRRRAEEQRRLEEERRRRDLEL